MSDAIVRTTSEEWALYRSLCYPEGLPPILDQELQQAFFAGALTVLTRLHELKNGESLERAQAGLEQIDEELVAWHKARLKEKGVR